MHLFTIWILIVNLICIIGSVSLRKFFGFSRDSVPKPSSSFENDTTNITEDSDFADFDDDNGGKDCPSIQKAADLIPWGDSRSSKCCLDKSSSPRTRDICYTNMKGTPWESIPRLPFCPSEIGPEFYIFTPEDEERDKKRGVVGNNNVSQNIDYANLNKSANILNITKSRQFFVIVHGFHTKAWDKNWMFTMKDILIALGHNVMVVKWTNGSNIKDYGRAAANTRSVGSSVANVLDAVINAGKVTLDKVTFIGFSLGAHICGYVGSLMNGQLPRILALDPAGPLFACQDQASRLDPTDAKFVQVVHTNGASFFDGGLGTPERMGHVDFYPNGGLYQPGCPVSMVRKIAKKFVSFNFSSVKDISCSHSKAPLIATDILRQSLRASASKDTTCRFQTFPCSAYKDWKWGRCFKPCLHPGTTSEECPIPGLDLLFSAPKFYKQRFFFNTLTARNYSDVAEFCGREYMVTLKSPSGAKGGIKVKLFDEKGGWSDESIFQRSSHRLKSNVDRSEVITTFWQLAKITKIQLEYVRYTSRIYKNGPMWFTLNNATVQATSGEVKQMHGPSITVADHKPVVIDLS